MNASGTLLYSCAYTCGYVDVGIRGGVEAGCVSAPSLAVDLVRTVTGTKDGWRLGD